MRARVAVNYEGGLLGDIPFAFTLRARELINGTRGAGDVILRMQLLFFE